MIELPAPIRAWLVEAIERSWPQPGPVVAAIPSALPPGEVRRLAGGGPFGLMFDGRHASEDEREAAEREYFAHNRRAYDHLRERGFFS